MLVGMYDSVLFGMCHCSHHRRSCCRRRIARPNSLEQCRLHSGGPFGSWSYNCHRRRCSVVNWHFRNRTVRCHSERRLRSRVPAGNREWRRRHPNHRKPCRNRPNSGKVCPAPDTPSLVPHWCSCCRNRHLRLYCRHRKLRLAPPYGRHTRQSTRRLRKPSGKPS